MTMRNVRAALLVILAVIAGAGCAAFGGGSSRDEAGIVEGVGVIDIVEEGSRGFGITTEEGARFLPRNLPRGFQQPGKAVRFRARLIPDDMTLMMWGTPVQIEELEAL